MSADETFKGSIGRTIADSTPWWPTPNLPPAGSPDVIMVVFDDVGFSDFGCFGSEINTPTLNELAAGGLRYNNFHTTALCSPTRACLMTGRNHHSVGMGVVSNWDTGFPGYRGRVAKGAGTLAEVLAHAGYATLAVGKWHLTPMDETSAAGPHDQWPLGRGFNQYYGFLDGATSHWVPDLVHDNHRIDPPRRDGYHLSADLADRAIEFVSDQISVLPEQPVFLYLCFGTAHSPLHAPADFIERYRGRFDQGWDIVRAQRLHRQVELGVVPAGTELAPRNAGVVPWDDLSADQQRSAVRFQEVYAAMIEHADAQLGRLIAFLRTTGRFDNTLLVALSDNGATLEGGADGSANYFRWVNGLGSEGLEERLAGLPDLGGPTTYPVYPMGWGQASNTPLKRYKQNTHAGGVRDPLIVSWPARIGDGGAVRRAFCHAVDIMPTILDLVDVGMPDQINGVAQVPIEGSSFASTLKEEHAGDVGAKHIQYFEMLGNRGIWQDGWKAVAYHAAGTSFDDDRWELYHLDEDFSECHDLAEQFPERLESLRQLWWAEAERYSVLPLDDRILERFLVDKPRLITGRKRFVYYPGARIPGETAASPMDVSYTIHAEIDPYVAGADGVLIAHGDRFSGYSLFVTDGYLCHDYNCAGEHTIVRSDRRVPPGTERLSYSFRKRGRLQGDATLLFDGEPAGEGHLARTLGVHINATGVSVGRDRYGPVSALYDPPHAFESGLRRVVLEIAGDVGERDSEWIAD
jgi:arylsulfatase A-like enzyme